MEAHATKGITLKTSSPCILSHIINSPVATIEIKQSIIIVIIQQRNTFVLLDLYICLISPISYTPYYKIVTPAPWAISQNAALGG